MKTPHSINYVYLIFNLSFFFNFQLPRSPQKKLVDELEQLRSAKEKRKKNSTDGKNGSDVKKVEYIEPTDEEDDFDEDYKKDPDWRATPLMKRIQVIF